MPDNPIVLDGDSLSIKDVIAVARDHAAVTISELGRQRIAASRAIVEKVLAAETPVYGISTGFGEFSTIFISRHEREKLQRNLILSHAAGVGEFLPEDAVRAAMLLRANSLTKGYSGIRPQTVDKLLEMLNKGVYPAVPCKGSVGASGDLAPLSHIALVMMGEGQAIVNGELVSGQAALDRAGIEPLSPGGKEGLALINGTQIMTAVGVLTWFDACELMQVADIAAALSLEALKGTRAAFDPRIARVRPHPGQAKTAANILKLTADSAIIASHTDCHKVQDAYSLRCVSQVHGASKDALRRVMEALTIEVNAATDNPLIMPDTGEVISGGNFHGQPVALAMDYLKLALAEAGSIAERRISRMLDSHLSELPPFLTAYPGIDSGLMITQYTAASLVSENKVLAHPACVDSIPTSANQEDHVSMGTIAARQAREILENVRYVLAIELLAACQGIDFLLPFVPGTGTAAAHKAIRDRVPHWDEDRVPAPDIEAIYQLISSGRLIRAVEEAVGEISAY
ncbi:MAG TPA: histidine ammonia-lyase [Methylomusa anaerophila]|uniref:Histidine ammonia-lyase n=1 Tax=Methylomusa anaerophila TaxID=1930071 RepID=A0A348AGP8_9FIRM|nr:histidine ammonia-lyase [Methylomusa anaerophila]BBB90246.1 histidine ammonia-lyase [Methylomusa anaerophila]HML89407.1 histidine ammonia-lyase [Methylomusa anaerophila]